MSRGRGRERERKRERGRERIPSRAFPSTEPIAGLYLRNCEIMT